MNIRLPSFTGENDHALLLQMRSYLYQLAQQLQYELNQPSVTEGVSPQPSVTSETSLGVPSGLTAQLIFNAIKPLIIRNDDVMKALCDKIVTSEDVFQAFYDEMAALVDKEYFATDFVVENGTTEGWTWRKWKSGVYEMFGEFSLTTTKAATSQGSIYYSEVFTIKTPFAVKSTYVTGAAHEHFVPISENLADDVDSENNIGVALWRATDFDVGSKITVRLTATGHIKTT